MALHIAMTVTGAVFAGVGVACIRMLRWPADPNPEQET